MFRVFLFIVETLHYCATLIKGLYSLSPINCLDHSCSSYMEETFSLILLLGSTSEKKCDKEIQSIFSEYFSETHHGCTNSCCGFRSNYTQLAWSVLLIFKSSTTFFPFFLKLCKYEYNSSGFSIYVEWLCTNYIIINSIL